MTAKEEIAYFREQLLARRKAIVNAGQEDSASTSAVELDQSRVGRVSRVDAMQAQAMSVAAAGRREQEIARIDAALARMDEGEYGYCLKCGREIVSARLQIDPAASHCVDCAASLER
ncbi:MAG: TraR/DksA family transcriptional regulator [Acidiferrobacterales bacterium]|jgi:DnaK suppressor protein|nr:TraR/DksA family transcriptional regulator [Acidiferrobacterales bacterium]